MKTDKTHSISTSLLGIVLGCGALLIFAAFLSRYFIVRPGHDQSSYLFEAQRLLGGFELYGPHLSETNTPMIVWFSVLPVTFASWVHGSPVFFLRLLMIAMVFGSVAWCVRILRCGTAITNPVAIGLLGCSILAIEFSIGPYEFAQRENLLVILLFPYILAAATGVVNRLSFGERCALGIAAGIAIWFKPQYTIVLVGLEMFLAFRLRSLRRALSPEFVALVLTSSVVLLLVRVITPLYGKETVPLLLDTYWGLGNFSALQLAVSLWAYMAEVSLMLLACVVFRKSLRDPATTVAFLICSLGASIAYEIQHTQWPYHRYPHKALFLFALAYLVVDFLYPVIIRVASDERLVRGTLVGACAVTAVVLVTIGVNYRWMLPDPSQLQSFDTDRYLSQYGPSTTVYTFSTDVRNLSSVYNHGLNWGGRFAHLWMLPAILQNELGPTTRSGPFKKLSPETLNRLATLQRTESAEDLKYWRPSVVLVENCNERHTCVGIEGKDFDMIAWFLQSPEFATEWSHYQRQPGVDNVENYDIYKRVR
jgi:hypothetical protein